MARDMAGWVLAAPAADQPALSDFYSRRNGALAWSGPVGESQGDRLILDLQARAIEEGLPPEAYGIPVTTSDEERDVWVTDALLRFGHDLAAGRVAPSRAVGGPGPELRPAFDGVHFLRRAGPGIPLAVTLGEVGPKDPGYPRLKAALARYRAIVRAGGWPMVGPGPVVAPNGRDPRIPAVRRELMMTGDMASSLGGGDTLDPELAAGIRHFQGRMGLAANGRLDDPTRAALAVPAGVRLAVLLVNLDRWRATAWGNPPIAVDVNIAAQTLAVAESGKPDLAMRVAIGDRQHPTPALAAAMTAVVLNPVWTVPPSIAAREILPKLAADPGLLARKKLSFADRAGTGGVRLRQQPGPDNALGLVKFRLNDSDDIYLHDTPRHGDFRQIDRTLSHGCVRVENPVGLAERMVGGDGAGRVQSLIASHATHTLRLDSPVAVRLMYWTAWTDADGTVHFRDDIYGYDARLRTALAKVHRVMIAGTMDRRNNGM